MRSRLRLGVCTRLRLCICKHLIERRDLLVKHPYFSFSQLNCIGSAVRGLQRLLYARDLETFVFNMLKRCIDEIALMLAQRAGAIITVSNRSLHIKVKCLPLNQYATSSNLQLEGLTMRKLMSAELLANAHDILLNALSKRRNVSKVLLVSTLIGVFHYFCGLTEELAELFPSRYPSDPSRSQPKTKCVRALSLRTYKNWRQFDLPAFSGHGSLLEIYRGATQCFRCPRDSKKVKIPMYRKLPAQLSLYIYLDRRKNRKFLLRIPSITAESIVNVLPIRQQFRENHPCKDKGIPRNGTNSIHSIDFDTVRFAR